MRIRFDIEFILEINVLNYKKLTHVKSYYMQILKLGLLTLLANHTRAHLKQRKNIVALRRPIDQLTISWNSWFSHVMMWFYYGNLVGLIMVIIIMIVYRVISEAELNKFLSCILSCLSIPGTGTTLSSNKHS